MKVEDHTTADHTTADHKTADHKAGEHKAGHEVKEDTTVWDKMKGREVTGRDSLHHKGTVRQLEQLYARYLRCTGPKQGIQVR